MSKLEALARAAVLADDARDHEARGLALADIAEHLAKLDKDRLAHEGTIEAARSNYTSDSSCDIEIDDVPDLSIAEDGVWVSAWVWVPVPIDEEDEL